MVRPVTVNPRSITFADIELGYRLWPKSDHGFPRTRAQCKGAPRPCPYVSCRYHLYLDVNRFGAIKYNFPDLEVWEIPQSCALDVADKGPVALERIADLMNITRQAAQLIEGRAKNSMIREGTELSSFL